MGPGDRRRAAVAVGGLDVAREGDGLAGVGARHPDQGPFPLVGAGVDVEHVRDDEQGGEVAGSGYGDRGIGVVGVGEQPLDPGPRRRIVGRLGAGAHDVAVVLDPGDVQVARRVDRQVGIVFVLAERRHLPDRPVDAAVDAARDVDVAVGAAEVGGFEDRVEIPSGGTAFDADVVVVHVGGVGEQPVVRPGRPLYRRRHPARGETGRVDGGGRGVKRSPVLFSGWMPVAWGECGERLWPIPLRGGRDPCRMRSGFVEGDVA